MSVPVELLCDLLRYTRWSTARLLDAAANLDQDELTRDFHTADKSVLGTLAHIFAADRIWLNRVRTGPPNPPFIEDRDRSLPVLQAEWPTLHREWLRWAENLTQKSVDELISYVDLKGREWQQAPWQIVLHVINHATHHRGQVSGFLRIMGHTPPPLDLIAYYRQL